MIISYKKLREFLANTEKYPGCKKFQRAPLIHKGFPGTFNLSFTEYDMFRVYGGYSKFSEDLIFSTIQSCIRPQDITENIKQGKSLWKYLGVFEMSDIAGQILLSKKENIKEIHTYQLKRLIGILIALGLEKDKIYPSYQNGGKVSVITNGKFNFDYNIPEDSLTKNAFIEAGIPKENLISDKTRDTLLSLHINMPTPWGYRNEINYNIGTKEKPLLLDIATLEYFIWLPIFKNSEIQKNITGLKEFSHTASIGAFGVERLCVAINGLKSVYEIDYLKEFYDLFKKLYPSLKEEQRIKSGEVIRALHRIYSDVTEFNIDVGYHENKKIKTFLQVLVSNLKELDKKKIKQLLEIHSKVQPWHKNLLKGIKPAIERIETYYSSQDRLRVERSTKPEKHQQKKLAP
ncbi:MAG: hypothetical protein Q8O84_01595 [Nanoarchaeota archaeon]|nr:hypothetical protein [Nanoarchaeota archaeon]